MLNFGFASVPVREWRPTSLLDGGLLRFCRDRRGLAAVEFGLIATLFVTLLCFLLEMALSLLMQVMLDNATRDAARQLKTGVVTTSSAFQTALCNDLSALLTCANIKFRVVSGASFSGLSTSVTVNSSNVMTNTGFSPGSSGQDVVVQVAYTRTILLPIVSAFLGSNGALLLVSTLAYQNEPT
jgi:Flp pilus assembly protein TadG